MRWVYQDLVEEAVAAFVGLTVPDAGLWPNVPFDLTCTGNGGADTSWRVELNLPTSSGELWLCLEVSDPEGDGVGRASILQALRDDPADEARTLAWDPSAGRWAEVPEEG